VHGPRPLLQKAAGLGPQPRVDGNVGAHVLLQVQRAQNSLSDEAETLGDADRRLVVDVDPQLDPFEAERPERPFRDQPQRAARHSLPAGGRGDDIADLALEAEEVEVDDRGQPEERAVRREDREARPRALLPTLDVPSNPRGAEAGARLRRDACETGDLRIGRETVEIGDVTLVDERSEPDRLIAERRLWRLQGSASAG
jgi:hypothetical protein